ncbi:MAG: Maf family protein [Oscillospiraceae bacterium]|nr:Maf family protein [Oscillospiraceae bacterium]
MRSLRKRALSLTLAFSLMLSVGASAPVAENNEWESKITPELQGVLDTASSEDRIPVWIWSQDIDQEAVEQETEREIGFSVDEIEIIEDDLSAELAIQPETVMTNVESISEEMLEDYLATGLWEGKAGAFGYQDGNDWLRVISGSETNVVGLPVERLGELMRNSECGIRN